MNQTWKWLLHTLAWLCSKIPFLSLPSSPWRVLCFSPLPCTPRNGMKSRLFCRMHPALASFLLYWTWTRKAFSRVKHSIRVFFDIVWEPISASPSEQAGKLTSDATASMTRRCEWRMVSRWPSVPSSDYCCYFCWESGKGKTSMYLQVQLTWEITLNVL